MTSNNLDKFSKKWNNLEERENTVKELFQCEGWKWPSLKETFLAKYYLSLGYKLYCSAHEGLGFSYNVTKNILNFLNNNSIIKNNLFNFYDAVEEFSLQTISIIEINELNLEYGFFNIGHGCLL